MTMYNETLLSTDVTVKWEYFELPFGFTFITCDLDYETIISYLSSNQTNYLSVAFILQDI